ncbi:Multiple sugar-binding transport atp-binding protein msmk [Planctomycetales bacterium 10988]|nr:Multiple sugar-binding transport atp-binding protein msmk [Planctomycetales bacterium 10988]
MSKELAARFVKRFGKKVAIEADFQWLADRFSITVLFGPSGCGKTTTLRCLAGLERPEEGKITFGKSTWFDAEERIHLSPQQRGIGYLFQDYALFPHLTVFRNIAYGLRGVSRAERRKLVGAMLERFNLLGLEDRFPHQVSGGEQQRIALARVLVCRPQLLLLDEPLSSLDSPIRKQLRTDLRYLLIDFDIPVVLVTHDRIEAMALADHLIVLDQGRIRQQGPVAEVFNRPVDIDVARIVGMGNVQPGRIVETNEGLATVEVGNRQLTAFAPIPLAEQVYVCIQPEEVILQKASPELSSPRNRLLGTIKSLTHEGPTVLVTIDCGFSLVALVTRPASEELALTVGMPITALVKTPAVHLIPRS